MSSAFLLKWFWCFPNLKVRVWGVPCLTGLGSLVPALLFFCVPPTPLAQCWARGGPFLNLLFFRPSDRLHSMLGQGLRNRAAKLRYGTVVFSCSFFWSSWRRPLQLRVGGGQGSLATHTVAQEYMFCLFFVMHVILFSLCYAFSARHFPPLAGLWVVPPFHFMLVFAFCLAPPPRW